MMKRTQKIWMVVILSMALFMSSATNALAYYEDEYSEYQEVVKEPLKFECDYYKKEATLVYVDSSVTNLVIPEFYDGCVVTTISSKLHSRTYNNCVEAETVFIPSTVTTIEENAFKGCDNLKTVIFDTNSQIQNIGIGAFADCLALVSVKLPESIQCIDEYAFLRCPLLSSINIPSNTKKISTGAFADCQNLRNIGLNEGLEIIEDDAFKGCALETVNIPQSVKKIGQGLFAYCENLIVVSGELNEVPDDIFYNCTNLTYVTLSDNIKEIGSSAFYGTKIVSIKIPTQVNRIKSEAFQNCTNLQKVYFLTDPQSIAQDSFSSNSKVSLYGCYGGTVEACAKNLGLNFIGYHKPENVRATYQNGAIKLSWDEVAGANKYKVYRCSNAIGEFQCIATSDKNSFDDLDVQREKKYYYVIAVDQVVDGIEIVDIRSSMVTVKTPNATIAFTAKRNSKNNSVVLSWKKDETAENYVIYRSESPNGIYEKIAQTTKTTYTDQKVKRGKTYYYAVGVDLEDSSLKRSVIRAGIKKVVIPEATVSASRYVVEVARGKRTSVRVKFNGNGTIYVRSRNVNIARGEWKRGWNGNYCTLYITGVKKGTTKLVISSDYDSETCVITVKVK